MDRGGVPCRTGGDGGGKTVALRVLQAEAISLPEHGDHPGLIRAWREAHSLHTAWRMHYGLPPNDERVLSITETEVIHDLLVVRYWRHMCAPGNARADKGFVAGMMELSERASAPQEVDKVYQAIQSIYAPAPRASIREIRLQTSMSEDDG